MTTHYRCVDHACACVFLCSVCRRSCLERRVVFHLVFASPELMSASAFQEAVQESTKELAVADWRLEWVLRYSIIVKSRGIIRAKGYLVNARKASP